MEISSTPFPLRINPAASRTGKSVRRAVQMTGAGTRTANTGERQPCAPPSCSPPLSSRTSRAAVPIWKTRRDKVDPCSTSRFPGIDGGRADAFEIPGVPGNDGQIVGKRGSGDQ